MLALVEGALAKVEYVVVRTLVDVGAACAIVGRGVMCALGISPAFVFAAADWNRSQLM